MLLMWVMRIQIQLDFSTILSTSFLICHLSTFNKMAQKVIYKMYFDSSADITNKSGVRKLS